MYRTRVLCFSAAAGLLVPSLAAQNALYPGTQRFIAVDAPVVFLDAQVYIL